MRMCPVHKKHEVREGRKRCVLCQASYIRFSEKHRNVGRCLCGGTRVIGYRKCAQCRKEDSDRRELRKLTGLCLCGQMPLPGRKGCQRCTEKAESRRLKHKKVGLCQCGRTPSVGSKVCNFCRELGVKIRIRTKANGLCQCGQPPSPGYTTCSRCRIVRKANYDKRVREDKYFVARAKIRGSIIYGIIRSKGTKKSQNTETLLGCTIAFARKHIEKQFLPGMSWHSRELWHLDHHIPCEAFDITDARQQRLCNNWRNLRPLWEKDNLLKSTKLPPDYKERIAELEATVL